MNSDSDSSFLEIVEDGESFAVDMVFMVSSSFFVLEHV